MSAAIAFARAVDRLNEHVGRAVALLLLPCILITAYEVVMRYVFNRPTIWVNESTQIIFGFYFLLGGAYTLLHHGHVRVDVLLQGMSARGRRRVDVFGLLVAVFFLSVLLLISGGQAWDSIASLERAESVWEPYIFPILTELGFSPMREIYLATPPFIALQALGLLICAAFPELIMWLPNTMFPN